MGALNAVILYVLVSMLSEGGASEYRWRILIIAVGSVLLETVLLRLFEGWLWALAILVGVVLFVTAALILWCATPRKQALKIAGLYTGIRIAIGVVLILVAGVA